MPCNPWNRLLILLRKKCSRVRRHLYLHEKKNSIRSFSLFPFLHDLRVRLSFMMSLKGQHLPSKFYPFFPRLRVTQPLKMLIMKSRLLSYDEEDLISQLIMTPMILLFQSHYESKEE